MTMRRTRNGVWWVFALALVFALTTVACGGSSNKDDTTPEVDDDDDDDMEPADDDDDGDVMIPEEKFMTIQSFFDRKSRIVSRCFVDGVEADEIDKDAKVMITVTMVIQESGKVTDVTTAETNTKSQVFEDCVHEHVRGWKITTLPKPLDYSYTFAFDTL